MKMSQKAFNLIVNEETGGEAYYLKSGENHPDWPGGASGVTIGIGYDCGYETAAQITADWGGKIPSAMVAHLSQCAGIHGSPAHSLAHELWGSIAISWGVALDVFKERDVPKWEGVILNVLPNADQLSGDSFGALVSLAFNRGASFSLDGDRYFEMRNIKRLMRAKDFSKIPDQIRHMKRLWPNSGDLRRRRDHEASLFEEGLVVTA